MVTDGITILSATPTFLSLYASARVDESPDLIEPEVMVGTADTERFPSYVLELKVAVTVRGAWVMVLTSLSSRVIS